MGISTPTLNIPTREADCNDNANVEFRLGAARGGVQGRWTSQVSPQHTVYVFNQDALFAECSATRPETRFGLAFPLQVSACDASRNGCSRPYRRRGRAL
jgi:hypothetical protein